MAGGQVWVWSQWGIIAFSSSSWSLPNSQPSQLAGRAAETGCLPGFVTIIPPLPTSESRRTGCSETGGPAQKHLPSFQCHHMGLLSHCPKASLRHLDTRSQNGHLLAHLSVPRRTCVQTGVPARGGLRSKGTTCTHRTQTQERGVFRGDRPGEPRWGIQHVQPASFWLSLCGGGRGEQNVA